MSLRAKIEAVVYAAEEPVTLVQLAALFADEALVWKREHPVPADASAESVAPAARQVLLPAGFDLTADPAPADGDLVAPDDLPAPAQEPASEAMSPGAPTDRSDEAPSNRSNRPSVEGPESAQPAPSLEAAPEAEARRLARQRDREVRDTLHRLLDELIEEYAYSDRGIEIREIAGGYRIGTKPEYHDSVRTFVKSLKPPMKLSLQALETLAVIAYKQPVTVPEVSEIRGVDTSGVLGSLMARKLVTTAGRKQVIGRPILYKTTKEFLLRFGLKDVSELPSIEEFEKIAGELIDSDPAEEPDTHPATAEELPFLLTGSEEQETLEAEPTTPSEISNEPGEEPPEQDVTPPTGKGNAPPSPEAAPERTAQGQAAPERAAQGQAVPERAALGQAAKQQEASHPVSVPAKEED